MRTMERPFFQGGLILLTVLFCSSMVLAGGGPRDHSGGFFLRLSGGGGTASTKITYQGVELKMDGASGDANIAIGAIVSPNLAIHGTLFGWLISNPDISALGATAPTSNFTLDMSAVGGGLTYYFMPANIYISASIGVSRLHLDVSGFSGNTDAGFASDFTVGKEWWAGNNWGLGVAVDAGFHSIPDPDIPENWKGGHFGIRFSATMN